MNVLTISAADRYLAEHIEIHQQLLNLIKTSIAGKKAVFAKNDADGAGKLVKNGLLTEHFEGRVEFNFDSIIICRVYQQVAEEMMNRSLPTEIVPALEYVREFLEMICQPKPRTIWYLHLGFELERYILVWLNQEHDKDISKFYPTIDQQAKDDHVPLRHFDMMYYSAFPYLNDDIPKAFEMLRFLYIVPEKSYLAKSAISEVGEHNIERAQELYEYAKENNGIALEDCMSGFLSKIYERSPEYAFKEIKDVFIKKPVEGASGFSTLNYQTADHIRTAYELLHDPKFDIVTIRNLLPKFYTRVIENVKCPDDIREECFKQIDSLLDIKDLGLNHDLIFRLGLIEGNDEQKVALVNKVILINPRYLEDIFKKIKNPTYLFGITRQAYIMYGPAVNFGIFSSAFSTLHHHNSEGFELELLSTLVDNQAVIRLAGMRIMSSQYMGMYKVDFLKLNEKGQIRIIKTLLPHPHSIEDLLPMILKLRKSDHKAVRKVLLEGLNELIDAYDENLLDLVKKDMDEQEPDDIAMLESLKAAFDQYIIVKKHKEALKEFDPRINELQAVEDYFKIEHESRAESMDKVQQQSFFAQTASHTAVIRGDAYKSIGSEKISKLSTVSTSRLMDMRYFMNPDEYQWAYQQQLSGMDYTDDETP